MKTHIANLRTALLLIVLLGSAGGVRAQSAPGSTAGYAITERGPHSRVWQKVVSATNELGRLVARTNSYQELATGLYYSNSLGQLEEAKEIIETFPGGAVARQGQHKVIFAQNLATAGTIDMEMVNGQRLQSHVIGLSLFDSATGRSVLIAEVKDCVGVVVPPNQVLYLNAFSGLSADVRYTYTRAGFSQCIILREQPPSPESFGLNRATTRLEVLTEFLNSPTPAREQRPVAVGVVQLPNEDLKFGTMRIGRGRAFVLGEEQPGARQNSVPVGKQFLKMDGRDFLVEQVTVPSVQAALDRLPKAAIASVRPATGSVLNVVSAKRLLPGAPMAKAAGQPMQVASTLPVRPGYVLDYEVVGGSGGSYTFESGYTYFISDDFVLGRIDIEADAVIKMGEYTYGVSADEVYCPSEGQAIWTSMHDNSAGETISGSTGNPGVTDYRYLQAGGGGDPVHNLAFRYAQVAITTSMENSCVTNCSFSDCIVCVRLEYEGSLVGLALYDSQLEASGLVVDFTGLYSAGMAYGLDVRNLDGSATDLVHWPEDAEYGGVSVTLDNCCASFSMQNLTALGQSIVSDGGSWSYNGCWNSDHNAFPDSWEMGYFGHLGVDPNADPDVDGFSNLQEYSASTSPINPMSVQQVRLGYWSFDDTNTWAGAAGQLPTAAVNVSGVSGVSTNAVMLDQTNGARLRYRDVETSGSANITCRGGTVRFWFKPSWNSSTINNGTGPGSEGRLIEMGTSNGWWGLILSSNGTQISFLTKSNNVAATNLTAQISWASNEWHQIVLTYGTASSCLYLDGQTTNGFGVTNYPNASDRSNGFGIGSDWAGSRQARGRFDELETFNYPLSAANAIEADSNGLPDLWEVKYFGQLRVSPQGDADGDGLSNLMEYLSGTNPKTYTTPNGLTGSNPLQVFTPLK